MSAPLLQRLLTREECNELSDLLASKYLARHNLGTEVPPSVGTADAGSPLPEKPALTDDCDECGGNLVTLAYEDCVVRPCPICRPAEALAFAAGRPEADEARDTIPAPPPEVDPWDVPEEDQNRTADLRERFYYGDRAAYDPHDDKSDIDAHDRLTSYPWGPK
jgi:hypothetical protein